MTTSCVEMESELSSFTDRKMSQLPAYVPVPDSEQRFSLFPFKDTKKTQKAQKLNLAAFSGNEDEVMKLVSEDVDVNIKDSFGLTPLHNAILSKKVGIVVILLKSGADVKGLDEKGDTPLHVAVRVESQEIVGELLKEGRCDVNFQGFMSYTPLHIAAQTDNVEICKKLVEMGGDITLKTENKMTSLGVAVSKGAQSVVGYFFEVAQKKNLEIEAMLYNADSDGSTLLHLAVDSGLLEIVVLCLKNGASVRNIKESDNSTAFHLACAQSSLDIVQLLHNEDREATKLHLTDNQGMTPLHKAAASNNARIASFLIEQRGHVNALDMKCRTPLFLAASAGGTDTVQLLMGRGADVTLKDMQLRSVLHAAIGHSSTIEKLLESTATKPLITDKDVRGYAPIHYAIRDGHSETVALFISKNKAAATVISDSMFTPLHIAAKFGWPDIVQKLVKKRSARMINCRTNKNKTPLHLAAYEGHDEIVDLLLMEGATIEKDHLDCTPLHMAAMCGSERCVEGILQTHPDCLNFVDKNQNTALHLAAMSGHAGIVTYLLSVPEQTILLNSRKENVIGMAISAAKEDVAMTIIEHARWKEVVESASGGGVAQLQTLVEQMPNVAERFLDQCVKEDGDPCSKDYKIIYDLQLIQGKKSSADAAMFENSLAALKTMAERRRENCLNHPVCYVLMNIKWERFGWITFIVNFYLYLAFLLPFTALAVYQKTRETEICGYNLSSSEDFHDSEISCNTSGKTVAALNYFAAVFAFLHLSKECIQVFRQRLKYLTTITNYVEWIIYVAALSYLLPVCFCKKHFQVVAAAITLFFGWLNLVLYFRRMAFHGKYVIMFLTMCKTLARAMLLLLLFVIAFGTTFYILMYNQETFDTYYYSLIKTFVMLLGELDYADMFVPHENLHYSVTTNIVFVLFCLGMPIILMNMLVGLAVGDIGKIQQKSVMERYVMQVELLLEIEESLPSFIMRRVQVDKHEEYPNRKPTLTAKVKEKLIGFGQANSNKADEDNIPPAMARIIDNMQDQESRINEIYEIVKEQNQLLKLISGAQKVTSRRRPQLKNLITWSEGLAPAGRKSFIGLFKKK